MSAAPTPADYAALLDAIDPNVIGIENASGQATEILLAAATVEVRAAYLRLVKRSPWWATA